MTEAAIISGSLVDVRNVGTHKSVKLTIHVPEELAMRVMEAFGWPTGVNPVEVAIARLEVSRPVSQAGKQPEPTTSGKQVSARADKERRQFSELQPAQQAGILCNEEAFWKFLRERDPKQWLRCHYAGNQQLEYNVTAAAVVRELCSVDSRADITPDNADWSGLVLAYRLWMNHPEYAA